MRATAARAAVAKQMQGEAVDPGGTSTRIRVQASLKYEKELLQDLKGMFAADFWKHVAWRSLSSYHNASRAKYTRKANLSEQASYVCRWTG